METLAAVVVLGPFVLGFWTAAIYFAVIVYRELAK